MWILWIGNERKNSLGTSQVEVSALTSERKNASEDDIILPSVTRGEWPLSSSKVVVNSKLLC